MFLCRRALFRGDKTGLSASKVRVFYAEKKGRYVSECSLSRSLQLINRGGRHERTAKCLRTCELCND